MKGLLLAISIFIALFFLYLKVQAQNQTVTNGNPTTAITMPGTGCTYNWVNNMPSIGLPASGMGDIPSFTVVNTGSSPVKATITATPMSAGYAYVTNFNDGTVSVINTLTNAVASTIAVGIDPAATAISPDGSTVYVANDIGTVSVINTRTNSVTATIGVGRTSHGIAISADGTRVYVTNALDNTVSVINTSNNAVIATIYAGIEPEDIVISPDGSMIYVVDINNEVAVINTSSYLITSRITVGTNPACIVESPDGSMLYVGNLGSKNVSVIDTRTNQVVATIPINDGSDNICISPDGKQVYIVDANLNFVEIIDTSTNQVTGSISVGSNPFGVSVSPDGSLLYVSDANSAVAIFDIATSALIATVNVGSFPIISRSAILPGTGCTGVPINFTITVNPAPATPPTITTGAATGTISACAGLASASPQIQQLTVSGSNLSGSITATAPANFEISLSAVGGYGNTVTLSQTGGAVNTYVFVRSAATAPAGSISGNVTLVSGAINRKVPVTGTVNALPTVNPVANQQVNNGAPTAAVNFTGTSGTYSWVNDTPGIGLAANGNGNIASFNAVNTGTSPLTATITVTPVPTGFAYIANAGSNNVTVINTTTNAVVTTIPVGIQPYGVSVSLDGSSVYVGNKTSNTVSVISTATNTVTATIPVGAAPGGVVASPDGSTVYVANLDDGTVSVINTFTKAVSAITVGNQPTGVAISPDGKHVYVTNYKDGTVSVINTSTKTVTATITIGPNPTGIVVSPDGTQVDVVSDFSNSAISFIDTSTNTVTANVTYLADYDFEIEPAALAISPDGNYLYAPLPNGYGVEVIYTGHKGGSPGVLTFNPMPFSSPYGVSELADGSEYYAVDSANGVVYVVNVADANIGNSGAVTGTIGVGTNPESFGNFITNGTGCTGAPIKFTIMVNPGTAIPPAITASAATGKISACAGTASASPQVQQFTVSGVSLTDNITAIAPAGFEISLAPGSGYGNSLTLPESGGVVNNTIVYVRAAASAPTGVLSGNVVLTTANVPGQQIAVDGIVNALPTVNTVASQTVNNGAPTTAINFTGTGNAFNWVNDTPGIGLAASGAGDIGPFNAVNNSGSNITATITVTPVTASYLYIANAGSNTVSVIDRATNSVITTIPVGTQPEGVSVSADGSLVYVANGGSSTVSVISTSTNSVISSIPVNSPSYLSASPDGSKVYVVSGVYSTVSVINTATNTVAAVISVGLLPEGLSVSPDGNWVYVANHSSNSVSVINAQTNGVVSTITVGTGPTGTALSPDGAILYVTNNSNNSVSVINTSTNAVISTIQYMVSAYGILVSPDGSKMYVVNSNISGNGTISVINTATNALITTIAVGITPYGLSISPDGSQLYVANTASNTISVINTATNAVTATIQVGTSPSSFGNFIKPGTGCSGMPVTFTIAVKPGTASPPIITASAASGKISGCVGTPSASPQIQQFTVSGSNLAGNITATAPAGFEVSLNAGAGYTNAITIMRSGGVVTNAMVCVRTAASAPTGNLSDNVSLTSVGAATQEVQVTAKVNVLPTVNTVSPQGVNNGAFTTAVNFTGTGSTFNWSNSAPGIGLAANGTGNIASFKAVNTTGSPVVAIITVTPVPASFAYIESFSANNISVVNTANNTVITKIPVSQKPIAIAASPDGSRVYLSNQAPNIISVVNTATNAVLTTIPLSSNCYSLAVSPDGNTLYASMEFLDVVLVINTTTYNVIATIGVGTSPIGVAVSPDGSLVYVANSIDNTASVINTATNAVIAIIQLPTGPWGVAFSPDGKLAYVTTYQSNNVSVINTSNNTVVANIPVGLASYYYTGPIVVSPDGSRIYAANQSANTATVINASTDEVIASVPVGKNPTGISITPDGSNVYVVNEGSDNVSVINTTTNTVTSTFGVDAEPESFGNFIIAGSSCSGTPVTFTITVAPTVSSTPTITANTVTGSISACAGTASASPQLQQITVSGSNLTADINVTAPANFEISLSANGSYGNSLTLTPSGGTVNNTVIYVRSAASAPVGNRASNLTITSPGAPTASPGVAATINPLPVINLVSNQTFANGTLTTGVTFTGTATNINWVNDTPGIGLAASGTGNIAPFTAINTGASPVIAKITATPVPVGFAYVVNANSNNVSVVNTVTNAIVTTIPVGNDPQAVAVSPDGSKVYVANNNDNTISVISTATNIVTSTFSVGVAPKGYPQGLAVSPDGSKLYVANEQSNEVAIVNTSTNAIVSTIAVGVDPEGIAVSPDGITVYVANNGDNTVSVINTATNAVVSTIPVGNIPNEIVVSPDGSKVYVTTSTSVAVIDAKTNSIMATVQDPGGYLLGIAISPNGSLLYAVDSTLENVLVINTSTNTIASTISVGYDPQGLSLTPDGTQLFVTRGNSNNIDVINTATGAVTATIAVGSNPISLGNFILPAIGCPGAPVTFTITVNPSAGPAVITATGSPSPLNTVYGTPSTSTIFTVSGVNMTAGILVTPPPGFEVSTNDINFSPTVTAGKPGTIAATTVYIRLASSTPVGNHYAGNIVLSSTGAPNVDIVMPLSTVTPADLTIIADNKSKVAGETNPVLTVSYSGFVNHDGAAQLTAQPVVATTAVTTSAVGQYPITVTGAASPNYNITFVQGTLTVNAVPLMVVIPNTFTPNGDGINDTWDIKYIDLYPGCTVQIFNRYGENIYSSIGYGTPWDGTYKGAPLPTSTYYYVINLKNNSKVLSGFVAIIK